MIKNITLLYFLLFILFLSKVILILILLILINKYKTFYISTCLGSR